MSEGVHTIKASQTYIAFDMVCCKCSKPFAVDLEPCTVFDSGGSVDQRLQTCTYCGHEAHVAGSYADYAEDDSYDDEEEESMIKTVLAHTASIVLIAFVILQVIGFGVGVRDVWRSEHTVRNEQPRIVNGVVRYYVERVTKRGCYDVRLDSRLDYALTAYNAGYRLSCWLNEDINQ